MKEYIKQIVEILKANNLTGITIDLTTNKIAEQYQLDNDDDNLEQCISDVQQMLANPEPTEDIFVNRDSRYYTVHEVTKLLGASYRSTYERLRRADVKKYRHGRTVLFDKAEVDAFLKGFLPPDGFVAVEALRKELNLPLVTFTCRMREKGIKSIRIHEAYFVSPDDACIMRELDTMLQVTSDEIRVSEIMQKTGYTSRQGMIRALTIRGIKPVRHIGGPAGGSIYNREEVMQAINSGHIHRGSRGRR